MTSNKIIKIFLASSSELRDDREQFEIFINRKNKEYIKQNIFFELVIWEDFLDAAALTRSQDEYNKAIAKCDVFVSLFKTKVGRYSEEEFLKAYETFKATGKPLIYTYFKNSQISLEQVTSEINSLLEFKNKLKKLGYFYNKYGDINELKLHFGQQIIKFLPLLTDSQKAQIFSVSDGRNKKKNQLDNSNRRIILDNKKQEVKRKKIHAQNFTEILSKKNYLFGKDIKLEMIAIPGGTFMMGSPEGEGNADEKPQHKVTVQPFMMGKYLITQAQYKEVTGKNPSLFEGDHRPVEKVSWNDAVEFCQKLSKQTGKEYRLPSEAEWEYACRAGTNTAYSFGNKITNKLANYGINIGKTTVVGKYRPNTFGLYDMHGNVYEWCQDNWHKGYKGAPPDGSAWLWGDDSNMRVMRGGSWVDNLDVCRSAACGYNLPKLADMSIGFRVVCDVPRTYLL